MKITDVNNGFKNFLGFLNNNKYFFGLSMIFVNIGSKYLAQELSQSNRSFFNNIIIRRITIFTIIFVATRDIKISLILTAAFIIFALNLFNENSKFCIIPESFRKYDLNKDNQLSAYEIEKAYLGLKEKGLLPSQKKSSK